jgi:tetratricopeptide (TPR) repeat protein
MAAYERAAALIPTVPGNDSPRKALADLAVKRGDTARAMKELETLLAYDHTNLEAARQLATLGDAAGDADRLRLAYERIVSIDPFDPAPHAALGRLALQRNDGAVASREFRAAIAAGPVDRASAHCDLAESYLHEGRTGDAKREAIAALEIAPTFERAQELLLKTVEARR